MNNDDYLKLHRGKKLNLETGIRCTLQCPDCARTRIIKKGYSIPGKDLTIEQFDKLSNFFDEIHFCGGWSDPIFNPEFIDMLKVCKEKNVLAFVHTAASHKSKEWYEQAFKANVDAVWIFGIDGLPKNSHRYRVNQDGNKLFEMMLFGKSLNLRVEWQYLIFDYNRKTIEKAKRKAAEHKIPLLLIETPRNSLINQKTSRKKTK
jgi:pyruvate-formate lyase-activating enzyme